MSADDPKRLRMFAGPNGSGKSSLIRRLAKDFSPSGFFRLHRYINADDFLRDLQSGRGISFADFGVATSLETVRRFLSSGGRIPANHPFLNACRLKDERLTAPKNACDSYVTAALADLLREELLTAGKSFTFETVMSHQSKVQLFQQARSAGYRTYLYFIATASPDINRHRVETRVEEGGHAVPEDKIRERYRRTLSLVSAALSHADRAYLFDNSGVEPILLAEKEPGGLLVLKVPQPALPNWFTTHVAPHFAC